MKKIVVLCCILCFAAGCNKEKKYSADLAGQWKVYKYLLNGVDQTPEFQSTYINYSITFTANGTFTETYGYLSDTLVGGAPVPDTATHTVSGAYSFTDQSTMLVLSASTYMLRDSVIPDSGYVRQYTLFDLTSADVQLVTDTSRLYMSKNQ